VTGNPLRAGFTALSARRGLKAAEPRLLVLGGSGGAQTLNEQVPRAIYKAGAVFSGWNIVHQTGPRDLTTTARLYARLGLSARITPFIDDMPGMLAATELAVSRAGGTTLAELAACGVPAVLLPFPRATDDHQRLNAEVFRAAGACRLVDERQVTGRLDNELAGHLRALAGDGGLRRRMAATMQHFARPDAAQKVAEAVLCQLGGSFSGAGPSRVELPRRAA
jgi:UDP-N-acetylglucosamine--N-acetylmuramyl-(pentapeptide) pyrophosphoryl-undecaprenol N-acetylglucosamine transferase